MITTILFDMGKVLIDWNPIRQCRDILPTEEDAQLVCAASCGGPDWEKLDAGILTEEEGIRLFASRLPERLHPYLDEVVNRWYLHTGPIPGMPELVRELSGRGYRLCLLTNAQIIHRQYWPTLTMYAPYFGDDIMLSAQWKLTKPDPAFFEKAISLLGFRPEESLFIDDHLPNVEAARACGIRAIQYPGSAEALRPLLQEAGVL